MDFKILEEKAYGCSLTSIKGTDFVDVNGVSSTVNLTVQGIDSELFRNFTKVSFIK